MSGGDLETFAATLAGAAVAGGVGVLTLLVQQRLDVRRRLIDEVLGPGLDYILGLPQDCPWSSVADPPWNALEPHRRLAIPRKFRPPLSALSRQVRVYSEAWSGYSNLATLPGWPDFEAAVEAAFSGYLGPREHSVPVRAIGIESGAVVELSWLTWAFIPAVLLAEGPPESAWAELLAHGPANAYWAKEFVKALRTGDPAVLTAVFEGVNKVVLASRAKALARAVRQSYQDLLSEADHTRQVLARTLGVRAALAEAAKA